MVRQFVTRRKRNTFWQKPKRSKRLRHYVDRNQENIFAADERVSQFDYFLDWLGRKDNAVETFWSQYGEQSDLIDWEYDAAGRSTGFIP